MKKLIFLGLLILNVTTVFANDADKAGLQVLGAQYNAADDSINVEVKHKGGCNDSYGLRLRGCADFFFPLQCQVDVVLNQGEACGNDVHGIIKFSRSELGLNTSKYSRASLKILGAKRKTKAEAIELPIVR